MGISALECFAISMRLTNEALKSKDTDRINEILEEMYVNNDGFEEDYSYGGLLSQRTIIDGRSITLSDYNDQCIDKIENHLDELESQN